MISPNRWWARAAAAVTVTLFSLLAPAVAWADSTGVSDLARRKPRGGMGFFGFFSLLCCLVVVVGIGALVYVLVAKNRNRNR